jgi:hypothetical protein
LPANRTIWINDATANPSEIEVLACRPVIDQTPKGRLKRRHEILQVPLDIKKSTSPSVFTEILRGVIAVYPRSNRIGVICHQKHVAAVLGNGGGANLDPALRSRITKVEHFRSGEGRGSNTWIRDCDLILVIGTPRVPPSAVKQRLIQSGKPSAATRDGEWTRDWWSGVDRSGKRHTIRTLAYCDWDWHEAHRAIVHAELQQAVGRGRAICDNGVPVVVVSNEPLGYKLLDVEVGKVNDSQMAVLEVMKRHHAGEPTQVTAIGHSDQPESRAAGDLSTMGRSESESLTTVISKDILLENTVVISALPTSQIARELGKQVSWVRELLRDLRKIGLVEKIGQRKGWRLTESGLALITPSRHTCVTPDGASADLAPTDLALAT